MIHFNPSHPVILSSTILEQIRTTHRSRAFRHRGKFLVQKKNFPREKTGQFVKASYSSRKSPMTHWGNSKC
jgi:hypothetical protein